MSNKLEKIIGDYSYFLDNKIGNGTGGEVYKGKHRETGELVAIKQIGFNTMKNENCWSLLIAEIKILKQMQHRNIVKQIETYQSKSNVYIVSEFCDGGDLRKLMNNRKIFPQKEALQVALDIAQGMNHCSKKGIIHRDLKPDNILLVNGVCKLIDFGFASFKDISTSFLGTPLYMSPQALNSLEYSNKCDV